MKRFLLLLLFLCMLGAPAYAQGGKTMAQGTMLHYIADHNIGDVHPYYDAGTDTWYMYYLKPNSYESTLLLSRDMLSWVPAELSHVGGRLANYFVLGLIPDGEVYRSWFGYGTSMASSVSEDLHTWRTAPYQYTVPLDLKTFPSGGRDPFVFFDEDAHVYRLICTAYLTNQLRGQGMGMKCMIAHGQTNSASLNDWGKIDTALITLDGLKGEPECSQAMKIGDRWYIFASMARRHVNHVGRLSYFIGDAGAGFLDQDWNAKQEHFLTGEDVCAAQIAGKGEELYLFGWITKNWYGQTWGGHLNLPYQVWQDRDGLLYTRLDEKTGKSIRGPLITRLKWGEAGLTGDFSRIDADVSFQLDAGGKMGFALGEACVWLDAAEGVFSIARPDGEKHVSFQIPQDRLAGAHKLRVIAEEDIVEAFLDDAWTLSARVEEGAPPASIKVYGEPERVDVYRLNYREELQP